MGANGDKRSVSTDALETLGTIITDGGRDAIHLAVEPVVAGETLYAGEHIGIVNGRAVKRAKKKLGIVDPFLTVPVDRGDKFWLVVYPRQITSLRHVWSHPDFPENDVESHKFEKKNEADELIEASRTWIENFADRLGLGYEELMVAAADWKVLKCQQFLFITMLRPNIEKVIELVLKLKVLASMKISWSMKVHEQEHCIQEKIVIYLT